ncbi:hypothetical protein RCO48_13990 [Peribacillus frigoritolerans]|nr:hypothetical protein [Peribacillus frigoritolerans]
MFVTDLGKELIIEVEDNGKGMSSDVTELIFRNGFTTKKPTNQFRYRFEPCSGSN